MADVNANNTQAAGNRHREALLTVSEVAALLHVHPNTVRHWADRGLLRPYRLGKRRDRRFRLADVQGLLNGSLEPAEGLP